MQISIVLYDGMTALDAVGPYEVLSRLPGAAVEFVHAPRDDDSHGGLNFPRHQGTADVHGQRPASADARASADAGFRRRPTSTDTGFLGLQASADLDSAVPADLVLVPGAPVPPTSGPLLDWLRTADRHSTWTTSVCTGSVVLAAAGLLTGRRATTHWLAMPMLTEFGAIPTRERVVFDGKYATAAGVSAGIDLALTLVAEIAGPAIAQLIQLGIEYAPQPPFDSGGPDTAAPELVAHLRANPNLVFGAPR